MAESIKEVIARLRTQKNSQQSEKKVEIPVKKEVPVETKEEDFEDEDEEAEIPQEQEKPSVKPQEQATESIKEQMTREQQIALEIAMLQDNGRFRAELLHQMQEQNKALVVIAGVLVDLVGEKK